jgi:hypothetical protein
VTRRAAASTLAGALALTAALAACRDRAPEPVRVEAKGLPTSARDAALVRARVWLPPAQKVGAVDFAVNSAGPGRFDPGADVDCTFALEPIGGSTPKFMCTLPSGERVKVKYGRPNGELPAEVASSRLLISLGFPTDRMNRVHSVRCHGCPVFPQQALQCLARSEPAAVCLQGASPSSLVTFEPAVIERPLEGHKIEALDDDGWSWYELYRFDPRAGGSPRAHVDALRLIAILLAHWDNKGANQKLVCPPAAAQTGGICRAPIAAIGDLGSTLGPSKIDLAHWKAFPIWTDAAACRVSMRSLPFGGATFPDTQISEAGRRFALELLRPLTRAQLETLFAESGVTAFPHVLAEARQPSAWADAFLDKVAQIEHAGPCAE